MLMLRFCFSEGTLHRPNLLTVCNYEIANMLIIDNVYSSQCHCIFN